MILGFVLGINGEGMMDPKKSASEALDPELKEDQEQRESVWFDINDLPGGYNQIKRFDRIINEHAGGLGPDILDDVEQSIDNTDLEQAPAVKNAVAKEALNLQENPVPPRKGCRFAAESIRVHQRDDLDRVPKLIESVKREIDQLTEGLYGSPKNPVTGQEVLRAACLSSNAVNKSIPRIVQGERDETEKKAAKQPVNNSLKKLQDKSSNPGYWEDQPIITGDKKPTDFGKLVAKIIIPDDRIRDTNRYLPTRYHEPSFISPTSEEIRDACYAFALDCPSETPANSWKQMFRDACEERL